MPNRIFISKKLKALADSLTASAEIDKKSLEDYEYFQDMRIEEIISFLKKELECMEAANSWLVSTGNEKEAGYIQGSIKTVKKAIEILVADFPATPVDGEKKPLVNSVNKILQNLNTIGFAPGSDYNGY